MGLFFYFQGSDVHVGESLGEHETEKAGSCSYVQAGEDLRGAGIAGPGPQQNAVGPHFHGTLVLPEGELFELEDRHGGGFRSSNVVLFD